MTDDVVILCDRDEAQELTDRIRETTTELWDLLTEAHERHAWKALGYRSWSAYVTGEFDMSRGQAYRLLHHSAIRKELASPIGDSLTPGQTRELPAGNAAPVLDAARATTGTDSPPARAIRDANNDFSPTNEGTKHANPQVEPGLLDPAALAVADLDEIAARVVALWDDVTPTDRVTALAAAARIIARPPPETPRAAPSRPATANRGRLHRDTVEPILKGKK